MAMSPAPNLFMNDTEEEEGETAIAAAKAAAAAETKCDVCVKVL